jgi:hypothetical protein
VVLRLFWTVGWAGRQPFEEPLEEGRKEKGYKSRVSHEIESLNEGFDKEIKGEKRLS